MNLKYPRVFGSTSSNPSRINTFSLPRYQQVIGYHAVTSNLVCSEAANFNLRPFLVHRMEGEEQIKGEQIKSSCIWTQIAEKKDSFLSKTAQASEVQHLERTQVQEIAISPVRPPANPSTTSLGFSAAPDPPNLHQSPLQFHAAALGHLDLCTSSFSSWSPYPGPFLAVPFPTPWHFGKGAHELLHRSAPTAPAPPSAPARTRRCWSTLCHLEGPTSL